MQYTINDYVTLRRSQPAPTIVVDLIDHTILIATMGTAHITTQSTDLKVYLLYSNPYPMPPSQAVLM